MAPRKKGGGKNPRAKATAASETETAKPSEVSRLTGAAVLKKLLTSAHHAQKDMNEIGGGHRQKLADAVKTQNLHKGAFAEIRRIDKMMRKKGSGMAEAKLYADTVAAYLDSTGMAEALSKVEELPLGEPAETEETEPETETGGDKEPNVVRPRFPAAQQTGEAANG